MTDATLSPTPPPPLNEQLPTIFYATMTTALGTVAALSWTDAIKSVFAPKGLVPTSATLGPWVVAILATLLAILGTRVLYQVSSYSLKGRSSMEDAP
jgi:hypothetical protein